MNHAMSSLDEFTTRVKEIITKHGTTEGYSTDGSEDSSKEAFDFTVSRFAGRYGHPLGEVLSKLLRFSKKEDPTDLIKAAGWLALIYRHLTDRTRGVATTAWVGGQPGRSELFGDAGACSEVLRRDVPQARTELGGVSGEVLQYDPVKAARDMVAMSTPPASRPPRGFYRVYPRKRSRVRVKQTRAARKPRK